MFAKKEAPQPQAEQFFVAMRKIGRLQPGDTEIAYQIEIISVVGDKIVKRWLHGKPDTKQMTVAKIELMINPDETSNPNEIA